MEGQIKFGDFGGGGRYVQGSDKGGTGFPISTSA